MTHALCVLPISSLARMWHGKLSDHVCRRRRMEGGLPAE